jgi:putative transcriptional regulator
MRAAEAVQLYPPLTVDSGLCLRTGGPVETHRGFLLLGHPPDVDESEAIAEGFHLTASLDVLRTLLEATPDPGTQRCRLLLGYAGWGPDQLDAELTASSWLTAPVDPDLVFGVDPEVMWEMAIRGLGVDPMALAPAPGLQ